jgi:hypothetical protein
MDDYSKHITKKDGRYELLYLTEYELGLSKRRRNKDQRVYTQEELVKLFNRLQPVSEEKDERTRSELIICVIIILILTGLLVYDLMS